MKSVRLAGTPITTTPLRDARFDVGSPEELKWNTTRSVRDTRAPRLPSEQNRTITTVRLNIPVESLTTRRRAVPCSSLGLPASRSKRVRHAQIIYRSSVTRPAEIHGAKYVIVLTLTFTRSRTFRAKIYRIQRRRAERIAFSFHCFRRFARRTADVNPDEEAYDIRVFIIDTAYRRRQHSIGLLRSDPCGNMIPRRNKLS